LTIFESIQKKAGKIPKDSSWYLNELISELQSRSFKRPNGFVPGNLYLFAYAPKYSFEGHDRFPLVFVIEMYGNGFLGCNLHYVSPDLRDEIANDLLNKSGQSGFAVPPQTLRRYLFSGVQGIPHYIPDNEWKGVVNLPTEKFVDKKQQSVRSAEKIKGT